MDDILRLSDEELRAQLKAFNTFVGPITDSTRRVYQLKLSKCREEATSSSETRSSEDPIASSNSVFNSVPYSDFSSEDSSFANRPSSPRQRPISPSKPAAAHATYSDPSLARSPFPGSTGYSRVADKQYEVGSAIRGGGGDFASGVTAEGRKSGLTERGDAMLRSNGDPMTNRLSGSSLGKQRYSYGGSPNLTSTPHNTPGGMGRDSIGVTPVSAFATETAKSTLFKDAPVNYPQMRQRVQPTAGGTPLTSSISSSKYQQSSSTSAVRRTAATPAPRTTMGTSESPGVSQLKKYLKMSVYAALVFFVVMGVLVWVNMEPTLNV